MAVIVVLEDGQLTADDLIVERVRDEQRERMPVRGVAQDRTQDVAIDQSGGGVQATADKTMTSQLLLIEQDLTKVQRHPDTKLHVPR